MSDQQNIAEGVELSIVIPCLNEVETVATCVRKAVSWITLRGVKGEVVVADNGSTDGSIAAARAEVRVVNVDEKGYGNALMYGIRSAAGKYVIMGDADDSYDFSQLDGLIDQLRLGSELYSSGMSITGRGWYDHAERNAGAASLVGKPMFSIFARIWFGAPIHDVYCGLRGFPRKFYESLNSSVPGWSLPWKW